MKTAIGIVVLILLLGCSIIPPKIYHSLQEKLVDDPFHTQQKIIQQLEMQGINKLDKRCSNADLSQLTLSSSLRIGLCKNPSIRMAWEHIEQASSVIGSAKSAYWPQLIANYDSSYRKNSLGQLNDHRDVQNATLELQWTLLDFGQRAANEDRAIALLTAQVAQYNQALQQQWANISNAYITVATSYNLLDIERKNLTNANENLDLVRALRNAGVVIAADVAQANVAVKRAELALLTAQKQSASARGELAQYLGYPVTTNLSIVPIDQDIQSKILNDSIDSALEQALQIHPNILTAQANLRSKEADIFAIESRGLPTVSLYGKYGLEDRFGNDDPHRNEKVVGIKIRWPLFTGFEHSYALQKAEAELTARKLEVERVKQEVALSIWNSWQEYQTAIQQLKVASDAIVAANTNLNTQRGRYRAGIGNLGDLLDAQRDLQEVSKAKVQAERRWYQARINLMLSVGLFLMPSDLNQSSEDS